MPVRNIDPNDLRNFIIMKPFDLILDPLIIFRPAFDEKQNFFFMLHRALPDIMAFDRQNLNASRKPSLKQRGNQRLRFFLLRKSRRNNTKRVQSVSPLYPAQLLKL